MNSTSSKKLYEKIAYLVFLVILGIGLYLRFYQHLMGRSLWEDEAHLAISFIDYGYLGLMSPLPNLQSAPIFFLWSVETFSKIFGNSELSLRMFPFIAGIVTLPIFYFMVKELTGNTLTALIAFLIFALNLSFIYYSSELKPYIVDVSVYVMMLYLVCSQHDFVLRYRRNILAISGALAIGYSNVSVIVLVCVALYLISKWKVSFKKRDKNIFQQLPKADLIVFGVWAVVFLANFFKFIYKHPYGNLMKELWAQTFCPSNIFSEDFSRFMTDRLHDTVFTDLLYFSESYYFPYVLLVVLAAAIVHILVTRNFKVLLFTLLPICIHLIMSMMHIYPFFYRFILYLLPGLIILVAIGVSAIAQLFSQKAYYVIAVPVIVFCCFCCIEKSVARFPSWDREIKPVLNFINTKYPDTKVLITTPWTLYIYYDSVGYAKNKNFKGVPWFLKPEQYYSDSIVMSMKKNYLLLYSVNGFSDGYSDVLKDLEVNHAIVNKFEYKTFGVAEIKPR
jgi:uncharacterized membrane protein